MGGSAASCGFEAGGGVGVKVGCSWGGLGGVDGDSCGLSIASSCGFTEGCGSGCESVPLL